MMPESLERALVQGLAGSIGGVEVAAAVIGGGNPFGGPWQARPKRLRHRIGLRPDAIRPDPPTPALQPEGDSPRNPNEILRLEISTPCGAPSRAAPPASLGRIPTIREPLGGRPSDWAVPLERISEVQPKRSVGSQNSANLIEDPGDVLDEELSSRLQSELAQPCVAGEAELAPSLPPCVPSPDLLPAIRGPRPSLRIAWDHGVPFVRTGRAPSPKDRGKAIVTEHPVWR